jgi:uncharacterized protein (TIGR02421 family)
VERLPSAPPDAFPDRRYDAPAAVAILGERLKAYFASAPVRVQLADGIVADAAAGSDYIKLRRDAFFTLSDLRMLEVHEGWVHLGTTLNGQAQPLCTFLGKGPPSATVTQEGLAVLAEVANGVCHQGRARRLLRRLEGIAMAESGASFLDVYHFVRAELECPRESYQHTMRIFRGGLPEGTGPFTKDICYLKGYAQLTELQATPAGASRVPLLCCGKASLDHLTALEELIADGTVVPARFLPPRLVPNVSGPGTNPLSTPQMSEALVAPIFSGGPR